MHFADRPRLQRYFLYNACFGLSPQEFLSWMLCFLFRRNRGEVLQSKLLTAKIRKNNETGRALPIIIYWLGVPLPELRALLSYCRKQNKVEKFGKYKENDNDDS